MDFLVPRTGPARETGAEDATAQKIEEPLRRSFTSRPMEHEADFTGDRAGSRYQLLLQVLELAEAPFSVSAMLGALASVLEPVVPVDAIPVVTVDEQVLRFYAAYFNGVPRKDGDSLADYAMRALRRCPVGRAEARVLETFPIRGSATEHVGRTRGVLVRHGLDREPLFLGDRRLRWYGMNSYVRVPLFAKERLLGSIAFCRTDARPGFTNNEVQILTEVSRPAAIALSRFLAYEEIERLRHSSFPWVTGEDHPATDEIIGTSETLRRVIERVSKVARTDAPVLISGETGTGKELLANMLHQLSGRRGRLVKVNCAALPETLMAAELFGHERGAFTGAWQRREGHFETAAGGSILLDEVGELPPPAQAALLRVLQDGEFQRIGGSRTLRTNARVIAATNRSLVEAVRQGRFREDLFYRLNVVPIRVPPLRERAEDIVELANRFAARYSQAMGRTPGVFERETLDALLSYAWPGNVRELQNVIRRGVVLSNGPAIDLDDEFLGQVHGVENPATVIGAKVSGCERELIEQALKKAAGKVAGPKGAAARLRIAPSTLEYKIRKYHIDKLHFRADAAGD